MVFCDLPDCVNYCAEPIFTGDHAGQIALTLTGANNEDCNDTFYGCYDFATGKWQVVIPDGCCNPYSCSPCGSSPPYYAIVDLLSVSCGRCYGEPWPPWRESWQSTMVIADGLYVLPAYSECQWVGEFGASGQLRSCPDGGCTCNPWDITGIQLYISVSASYTHIVITYLPINWSSSFTDFGHNSCQPAGGGPSGKCAFGVVLGNISWSVTFA